jgi:hypothetical protein
MPDQDLNMRYRAQVEDALRSTQQLTDALAKLQRQEQALNSQTQATAQVNKVFTEGIQKVNESSTAWSQKLVHAGQSMALGFTVPIISSLAVMGQFDRAATKLQAAEAFHRTAAQFHQSGDEIVEALNKASAETVSNNELMISASRALVAGIGGNTQKLVQLMEIARDRARVFGISTTEAFNRIVGGIAKQEKEILDDIGILFKANDAFEAYGKQVNKTAQELTEAEKVQAFLNAVLEQGEATVDRQALATRNATEEYLAQRAAVDNLLVKVQRDFIPYLTILLKLFNSLPTAVSGGSIALIGLTLLAGPLISALGSMGRILEWTIGKIQAWIAIRQVAAAAEIEAAVATTAARNIEQAMEAKAIVTKIANSRVIVSEVQMHQALAIALGRSATLSGIDAEAVIVRARAHLLGAQAAGIDMKATQALSIALGEQVAVQRANAASTASTASSGFLGMTGKLTSALTLATIAAAALYFGYKSLQKGASETAVETDHLKESLEEFRKAATNIGASSIEGEFAVIQSSIQKTIAEISSLASKDIKTPDILGFVGVGASKVLQDVNLINSSMDNAISAMQGYAAAISSVELSSQQLRSILDSVIRGLQEQGLSVDQINEIIRPFIDLLDATINREILAAQAGEALAGANYRVAESYKAAAAAASGHFAAANALNGLLGQIQGQTTREELAQQELIAQQQIVIANRKLEINQFGKQAKAREDHVDSLKAESDAMGKQIQAIDIQIREKELYIKSLVPPELLKEIEILEREVDARDRVSSQIGMQLNALSRESNAIQRHINVIERQARAVERGNRPLERRITLLDLEVRRIELASRAARRRLEDLEAIPGISQEVIDAARAQVDIYDEQINQLTDARDAMQIEVDARQAVADAIRDQIDVLNDQIDAIDEEIGILQDEQQAYDDTTSALQDVIAAKRDYIATLTPPELLEEIAKLKEHRDALDLQKQKLDLLIPTRDAVRASTGDTFDPIINNAQAAIERSQALLDKLNAMRDLQAIQVKMDANLAPGFHKVMLLIAALQKGPQFFEQALHLLSGPVGNSLSFIQQVAQLLGIPYPFAEGGVVTRPTMGMVGEKGVNEAVIPLNSPTARTIFEKPAKQAMATVQRIDRQMVAREKATKPAERAVTVLRDKVIKPLERATEKKREDSRPMRIAAESQGEQIAKPAEKIVTVVRDRIVRPVERFVNRQERAARPTERAVAQQRPLQTVRTQAATAVQRVERAARPRVVVPDLILPPRRAPERIAALSVPRLAPPREPRLNAGALNVGLTSKALPAAQSAPNYTTIVQVEHLYGNDEVALNDIARKIENIWARKRR